MRRALPLAILLTVLAAAPAQPRTAQCCTVTLRVRVPEGTGPVYLAGNLAELGPWRPDGRLLEGTGRERTVRVTTSVGTVFEYKFTLGTWDREALTPAGVAPPNHRLVLTSDTTVEHEIPGFRRDPREYIADWRGSGVLGRLVYWTDVRSQFLGPPRHVEIWLPPGYDSAAGRRYPVLYMSDGQISSTRASRTPAWTGAWTRRWCGWSSAASSRPSSSWASGVRASAAPSTRRGTVPTVTPGSSSRS
jgi:hypothetical protein